MTVDTTPTATDTEATETEATETEATDTQATDTESTTDKESTDAPAGGRRRPGRWSVVAGLVCVVLAAAGAFQVVQWRELTAQDRAATRASEAARTGVVTLLSYDYRTISADMAKARPQLTPAFAEQYDRVAASTVIPAATSQKVITSAVITGSSVVSRSEKTVVLLMFVNQSSTSSVSDKPQQGIDLSRVRVTMERVGDTWRIADVRGI